MSPLGVGAVLALEAGHQALVGMVAHGAHGVQAPLNLATQRQESHWPGLWNRLDLFLARCRHIGSVTWKHCLLYQQTEDAAATEPPTATPR